MKFSLLIATLNRSDEIRILLESLRLSIEKDFEIIIVDQSDDNLTKKVADIFSDLNIKYIKSSVKGLSFNRNIALNLVKGDYYCFPDDDCTFYPDTLSEVKSFFYKNNTDFVLGRIFDRGRNTCVLKKWPEKNRVINSFNCYVLASSITMFFSRKCSYIKFDENMGVGARYGACEDPDYLYSVLQSGFRGMYHSKIEVWHPEQKQENLPLEKITKYASGFGYYIRKNRSIYNMLLLLLYIASKIVMLISFRVSFYKFRAIITGIYNGFLGK